MLLNGIERLVLLNSVLPPEGSLLTMKLMHDLREALGLSEADLKLLHVEGPNQQIGWEALKTLPDKEVEVGTVLKGEVVTALNAISTKNKVTDQHLSLFEKFGATGKE